MNAIVRSGAWIVLAVVAMQATDALAQDGSREREMLRRVQAALQRSEQEKAKLQEEKSKLEQEKADLAAKLQATGKVQKELSAARKKQGEQAQLIEQTQRQLDLSKAKAAELETKLEKMTRRASSSEDQGKQLGAQIKDLGEKLEQQRAIIGRQTQMVQACDERNAKLVGLTNELVAKYRDKGVWDALAQREPFTGIQEVRIQNAMQEYREKADALKIDKPELRQ
jgi:chromosome segregation ATPase